MNTTISINLHPSIQIGDESAIYLSENARTHIQKLLQRESSADTLLIKITGGGCNGLSYNLAFVHHSQLPEKAIFINSNGIFLATDPKSLDYLSGTIIDYSKNLINGGFKFLNPNACSGCSCGQSFSI